MSYTTHYEIKELKLKIPKKDFPLRSDTIIGFEFPKLLLEEDEGSYVEKNGTVTEDYVYWDLSSYLGSTKGSLWEVEQFCLKYGGTLIMDETGEDGEVCYTRIRDGKKKTVRIVEED